MSKFTQLINGKTSIQTNVSSLKSMFLSCFIKIWGIFYKFWKQIVEINTILQQQEFQDKDDIKDIWIDREEIQGALILLLAFDYSNIY